MPGSNGPNKTRRDVLKATATLGVTAAATSLPASASGEWTQVNDRSIDYAASPAEIIADTGMLRSTAGSRAVENGERLVEMLADDGLLDEATLDALPTGPFTEATSEGIYHVTNGKVTNLGFRVQTSEGPLDVVFTENASPLAALRTDGKRVLYGTADAESYTRRVRDLDTSSDRAGLGSGGIQYGTCGGEYCPDCDCNQVECSGQVGQIICGSCFGNDCLLTRGDCC